MTPEKLEELNDKYDFYIAASAGIIAIDQSLTGQCVFCVYRPDNTIETHQWERESEITTEQIAAILSENKDAKATVMATRTDGAIRYRVYVLERDGGYDSGPRYIRNKT